MTNICNYNNVSNRLIYEMTLWHNKNYKYMWRWLWILFTGKLKKENLQKSIVEIQKEIRKLEYEVKDFMDENYVEFNAKLTRDMHLVKKTEQLLEESDILNTKINDQVCICHFSHFFRVSLIK